MGFIPAGNENGEEIPLQVFVKIPAEIFFFCRGEGSQNLPIRHKDDYNETTSITFSCMSSPS